MLTQRELDIMQVESQLRIKQLVEEWQRRMLKGRLPEELPIEETAAGQLEEPTEII